VCSSDLRKPPWKKSFKKVKFMLDFWEKGDIIIFVGCERAPNKTK